ncbi:MAG TPA: VWA domain-containing protein [Pyrinomonadaceae bacterium]|nr:VWA domain-containing protein [Pyrinomonadaceae bacterium]
MAQSRRIAPIPTPTPKDEVERIRTEEVKLNMLAFDEKGAFVPDVTANDIVITENNILHAPSSVRRIPANVLIVMDMGGELRQVKSLEQTRKVARAVVASLRKGDSIALLQYSDKAEIVLEWTNDKNQALAAINKTNFGRHSDFVSAINLARDFLVRNPADNRHLVLITDGTDDRSTSSAKFDALQKLLTTDISVHVISYTSMEVADIEPRTKAISKTPPPQALPDEVINQLPNDVKIANQRPKVGPTINIDRKLLKTMRARQAALENSQDQLEKVAEATNGEFILPETIDEMVEKAPLVAKMIDASYVVTYLPKEPLNDRKGIVERNIEVTSKRDGLVVQAKRKLIVDNGQ